MIRSGKIQNSAVFQLIKDVIVILEGGAAK